MMIKLFKRSKQLVALAVAAAQSVTSAAYASSDLRWSHGDLGKDRSSVYYAVPESDNIWIFARCTNQGVDLNLTIEDSYVRNLKNSHNSNYIITKIDDLEHKLYGKLEFNEMNEDYNFGTNLALDSALMQRLATDTRSVFKFGSAILKLDPSSSAHFRRMIQVCAGKSDFGRERAQPLVRAWNEQHAKCKGSWHLESTRKACDAREKTSVLLQKIGWCYGRVTDVAQDQANWHRCERASIRN